MFAVLSRLRDRRAEGFSLIELVVVVLIIGVLIGIALPAFLNQRRTAQDRAAQADLATVLKDAKSYYLNVSGDSYDGYTKSPDMPTDVEVVAAGHIVCLSKTTGYEKTWTVIDVGSEAAEGAPSVGTFIGVIDNDDNFITIDAGAADVEADDTKGCEEATTEATEAELAALVPAPASSSD